MKSKTRITLQKWYTEMKNDWIKDPLVFKEHIVSFGVTNEQFEKVEKRTGFALRKVN